MADVVSKKMDGRCGIGGKGCTCCNDYHGKKRKVLHRIVRRTEKQALKKETDR